MASKPKGPTKQQQQAEALQLQLLKKQLKDSQKPVEMPAGIAPTPSAPPPPPPPSASSADALEAATDAKRKAYGRTNANRGTLFAGETGGFRGGRGTGGGMTLLG